MKNRLTYLDLTEGEGNEHSRYNEMHATHFKAGRFLISVADKVHAKAGSFHCNVSLLIATVPKLVLLTRSKHPLGSGIMRCEHRITGNLARVPACNFRSVNEIPLS